MGHIQPDGAVAGEKAIWDSWRRLSGQFTTGRLIRLTFASGAAWGFYGVDLISGFARTSMARAAREIADALNDADFIRLKTIAEVNAQRSDAMWRLSVIFYITVPGGLLLASLDISPDIVRELVRDTMLFLVFGFFLFSLQMLFYFGAWWRARQIVAALEIAALWRPVAAPPPGSVRKADRQKSRSKASGV